MVNEKTALLNDAKAGVSMQERETHSALERGRLIEE
jgi:hypothetical protein